MTAGDRLHECIFGEVLFDVFPDGKRILGGAPFNVAWHLQAFRRAPLFLSRVGPDTEGNLIRQAMRSWGMALRGLQSDPLHPTGRVSVRLDAGEPSYDIVDHCAYDYITLDEEHELPACGLLYHGTLALRHSPAARSLERIKASRPGCVFVDVNLREPWWSRDMVLDLLGDADWVKLNRDELARLGEASGPLVEQARSFKGTYGLAGLVVTLGAEGAMGFAQDDDTATITPAPTSSIVDAVGAGDAFSAVLILGIVHAWPLTLTLERAQQFASAIVQQRGATVDDAAFYRPFIEAWGV
jgi:fructokinase